MKPSLSNITQVLLSAKSSIDEVKTALSAYKSLLLNASSIDIDQKNHQQHIQLDHGIAIGLSWAASCLDDHIRTWKFIQGTKQAIDQKLAEGIQPVHLIYAGTGPFATLVFPLLDHFSSNELSVSLIDVNPNSTRNVEQLVQHFGFENLVEGIYCADATSFVLPSLEGSTLPNNRKWRKTSFDILLSETMQHALQAELQVPICANLLQQMAENAILIPESINLDVITLRLESGQFTPLMKIGELMKVDGEFLRAEYPITKDWTFQRHFDVSSVERKSNCFIGIDTTIRVFRDHIIHQGESGLTVPKILGDLHEASSDQLMARYAIHPDVGFQLVFPSK